MAIIEKYSFAIFDFDGTICDTRESIKFTMNKTFMNLSGEMPDQQHLEELIGQGISLEKTIQGLHQVEEQLESSILKSWIDYYRSMYLKEGSLHSKLFNDVDKVFKDIRNKNISCVVISNKGKDAINEALTRFEIDKYVSLVIGGDQGFNKKPDPMIYNQIIKKRFSIDELANVLMIGDTSADIKFASNCKMDSCWASYGYGDQQECIALNPTHTISSISKLIQI